MKAKALAVLVAASSALLSVPASAADYNFSFDSSSGSGSGIFNVTGTTITGISGQYNGFTIDQLYAPGTVVDVTGAIIDNVFSPNAPYLTTNGVGFGIAGDNLLYNLYQQGTSGTAFYIATFPSTGSSSGSTNATISRFTVSPAATAGVPEPATWAMMITGFGLVGGAMRRRSTKIAFA